MSTRKAVENMYPLSPLQEGFLFHSLLDPDQGMYAPQVIFSLEGELDAQAFKAAWEQAIQRHGVLRSGFYWEQRDEPFQVVFQTAVLDWTEQDWQELSDDEQALQRQALIHANRRQAFDLQKPSLMRLQLLRLSETRYQLLWCHHHLILDGWSSAQLFKDVFQCYLHSQGQLPRLAPAPRPYADYIAWLKAQDAQAGQAFWQHYLAGHQGATLIADSHSHQGTTTQPAQFGQDQISLSTEQSAQLRDICRQHHITANTFLQGALAILLGQYTASRDVIFGYTSAGRPSDLPGATSMVGLFINSLPVRVQLPFEASAAPWLQQLQAQQAKASAYEYVSLREIQQHNNDKQALFDCLLVFESYPVDREAFQGQQTLAIKGLDFDEWTHYPLTLLVTEGEQIDITAKHRLEALSAEKVADLLAGLTRIIQTLLAEPNTPLHRLNTLDEKQTLQQQQWNTRLTEQPGPNTLTGLLERQRTRSAQQAAIVVDGESLSYEALHQQADCLALRLQNQGIGPEHRVALYLQRSASLMVALLAVMKTGAVYVPVEPSYPETRRQWILGDSQASLLLIDTRQHLTTMELPQGLPCWDLAIESNQHTAVLKPAPLTPDNAVYTLYTSGSTGKPKGVVNTHRGIVNRLNWMQARYPLSAEDRVLLKTPLGFDVSVWELFWPLITGATLVIAKPEGHKEPAYLIDCIVQNRITTLHFVPPMLSALLEEPNVSRCAESLKRVILSGEALSLSLQQRFFAALPTIELHNLYGPTEAAIDVTAWACEPMDTGSVPIGHPIANTQIYLLDEAMNPVPNGVAGELYIGGANLARGYLNRPDLTAERFVPNPFMDDGKAQAGQAAGIGRDQSTVLYKTGDLARYREDGAIDYIARLDHQVKIRGVRIELAEIEAVLEQYPGVKQAITKVFKDGEHSLLAAYLTLNTDADVNSDQLRHFTQQQLPDAMVPNAFEILKALPLTPNGKPNRQALNKPQQATNVTYIAPSSDTEKAIAEIWQATLNVDKPGSADNFFDLGGHSLIATRVISRLRKTFELEVPMQMLFERPVLADLAKGVDALRMVQQAQVAPPEDLPSDHKEVDLF